MPLDEPGKRRKVFRAGMKLIAVMVSLSVIAIASGAVAVYRAITSKWHPKNRLMATGKQGETT
jgi:hypothetical protein